MNWVTKLTTEEMSGLVIVGLVFPLAIGMILDHEVILHFESATHGFVWLGFHVAWLLILLLLREDPKYTYIIRWQYRSRILERQCQ